MSPEDTNDARQWEEINRLKDNVAEMNTNIELMNAGQAEQKKVLNEMLTLAKSTNKVITGNGDYKSGLMYKVDCHDEDIERMKKDETIKEMKRVYAKGKTIIQFFRWLFSKKAIPLWIVLGFTVLGAAFYFGFVK